MVNERAFIFHMCIPWDTSYLVLRSPVKVKYQGHNCQKLAVEEEAFVSKYLYGFFGILRVCIS